MVYVGLKYCGGCSAQFDRVALVSLLKKSLEKKAVFVSWDEDDVDLILVVCGCESACVNTECFFDKEVFIIFKEKHAGAFKEKIASME